MGLADPLRRVERPDGILARLLPQLLFLLSVVPALCLQVAAEADDGRATLPVSPLRVPAWLGAVGVAVPAPSARREARLRLSSAGSGACAPLWPRGGCCGCGGVRATRVAAGRGGQRTWSRRRRWSARRCGRSSPRSWQGRLHPPAPSPAPAAPPRTRRRGRCRRRGWRAYRRRGRAAPRRRRCTAQPPAVRRARRHQSAAATPLSRSYAS